MADNHDDNVVNIKPDGNGPDKFIKFLKQLSAVPIIIFLLIVTVPTTIYTVQADEDAVILRFGEYNRTVGPGLHFKLPFNFEVAITVPVRKISKMEFGFRTRYVQRGGNTVYDTSNTFDDESIMLTGDLNVVDVEWIIQYQVKDAKDFLFNVHDPRKNLFDISQAVMREVIGDHTVTEAITDARDEIANLSQEKMQKILDDYKMGIRLVALELQDVFPPEKVKPAFDEVNSAVQDAQQIANLAEKQRKKVIQEARGKAEQLIKTARAYKVNLINRAEGDTKRFLSLYGEFKKAPEITKKRLYFDQIKNTIKDIDQVYVVDPQVKGILPMLNLGAK
ncbi:MAG: FtsH protease activity modulator HflK [Deltaproteobacteria bacterium]|nr:FtsH protease activity modulator HflK [Deltaproteobacteria bacterium]